MKKLFYIAIAASVFTSCSNGGSSDKKTELEKLKKQDSELRDKIVALEKELSAESKGDNITSADVGISTISTAPFKHLIEVQAKVDADENISVSPQTMGTISRIHVKAGDKVAKGSILAELDNQPYVKSLDELKNAREFANTIFTKQKSLWDQKIGTEIQYLTAKNNLESLDKKIATVNEQLDMTRIKSPISGTVDQVDFKLGQAVAPGSPGMRVVNFEKLKIKAEVAEAYISKVKKDDDVQIHFPDLNKTLTAKVTYSGKVIDPMNRTFNVEVALNSGGIELHPNMVAIISITDYQSANAFVLPISVVQTTNEGSYVYIAEGSKDKAIAKKRNVVVGRNYNGMQEITEGLKSGDPVITIGYQNIVDGQPVKY